MIEARLHFIFFEDEINDLYTEWIEFDDSLNFKEIDSILCQDYRYLLFNITMKMGLSEDYAEDLITQIYEEKGRISIEIAPIDFRIG